MDYVPLWRRLKRKLTLLGIYFVEGILVDALHTISHLILTTILQSEYKYSHAPLIAPPWRMTPVIDTTYGSSNFYFILFKIFFLKIYLFIWQREGEHKQGEQQAEGEGEADSPLSKEPHVGLNPTGIMTWAEGRCLTDWAT